MCLCFCLFVLVSIKSSYLVSALCVFFFLFCLFYLLFLESSFLSVSFVSFYFSFFCLICILCLLFLFFRFLLSYFPSVSLVSFSLCFFCIFFCLKSHFDLDSRLHNLIIQQIFFKSATKPEMFSKSEILPFC